MMRSLFSAVSGLRVHQTKMDVIANNIANVNTAGYKSSRVTFSDVFNQTLSGASRASEDTGRGGRNPMQIGLGANVASIDQIMTTGASQRTDWAYDVMIQGEGFFILGDNSGYSFSRAGAFRIDESGNLTNAQGLAVNGWNRVLNTDPTSENYGKYEILKGKVSPIVITRDMEYNGAKPTSVIDMAGNLNAALDGVDGFPTTMSFYDTIGNRYISNVKYTYYPKQAYVAPVPAQPAVPPTGNPGDIDYDPGSPAVDAVDEIKAHDAFWTMEVVRDQDGYNCYLAEDPTKKFDFDMGFAQYDGAVAENPWDSGNTKTDIVKIEFDNFGNLKYLTLDFDMADPQASTTNRISATQLTLAVSAGNSARMLPDGTFGRLKSDVNGNQITTGQILFNMADLRQVNMLSDASGSYRDGMEPGNLISVSISESGVLTGTYSNGTTQVLAQIAIAQFKNPAGLEKIGGSLFRATTNSGEFNGVGVPPGEGGSSLLSGSLEMANVDLSQEFTEMITTQRGFQANSRVITTSDDMLQELVNLKR